MKSYPEFSGIAAAADRWTADRGRDRRGSGDAIASRIAAEPDACARRMKARSLAPWPVRATSWARQRPSRGRPAEARSRPWPRRTASRAANGALDGARGRPRLVSQAGKRLGACVEPLSRMRCRLRIRRHQTLPKSTLEEALEPRRTRLRSKQRARVSPGVHEQPAEQLDGHPGADSDRADAWSGRAAPASWARRPAELGWTSSHPHRRSGGPSGRASWARSVQGQNRDGPLQKARVGGPLPAVVLPRLDAVGFEPTLDGGA